MMTDEQLVTMALLSELLAMGVKVGRSMEAMGQSASGLSEFFQKAPVDLTVEAMAKVSRATECMDELASDCGAFVEALKELTKRQSSTTSPSSPLRGMN